MDKYGALNILKQKTNPTPDFKKGDLVFWRGHF